MEAKFCPFCQRKNKTNAVRCEHCGVLLISQKPEFQTTVGISEAPTPSAVDAVPCAQRIDYFPDNCFALFVMEFSEPIIIPIRPRVTLGRNDEDEKEENVVDFSRFGDVTIGISRRHATVYYENEEFFIEDMNSTNGTWLNRHRLMPGEKHPVKNDDQIWLGPLKMMFCLGSKKASRPTRFWLRHKDNGRKARSLSPNRLTTQIGPYLEALLEVDHIRSASLGLQENKVSVLSLIQEDDGLEIKLSNATDAVKLIHQWLSEWRNEHAAQIDQKDIDDVTRKSLISLALKIVESINPDLASEEKAAQAEMLFHPLLVLALSPQNLLIKKPV